MTRLEQVIRELSDLLDFQRRLEQDRKQRADDRKETKEGSKSNDSSAESGESTP